jgi:hypothetical protein
MQYRFSVPTVMSFSIIADSEEEAEKLAQEFVDTFEEGASVGPNDSEFDARVYKTETSPQIDCIEA